MLEGYPEQRFANSLLSEIVMEGYRVSFNSPEIYPPLDLTDLSLTVPNVCGSFVEPVMIRLERRDAAGGHGSPERYCNLSRLKTNEESHMQHAAPNYQLFHHY